MPCAVFHLISGRMFGGGQRVVELFSSCWYFSRAVVISVCEPALPSLFKSVLAGNS